MISEIINNEIFNITCKISDMAIDHIIEEFLKFGLHVKKVEDNDLAITFIAEGSNTICEMRIDRLQKRYEIIATKGDWTIIPAYGDWSVIAQYLIQLTRSSVSQPETST